MPRSRARGDTARCLGCSSPRDASGDLPARRPGSDPSPRALRRSRRERSAPRARCDTARPRPHAPSAPAPALAPARSRSEDASSLVPARAPGRGSVLAERAPALPAGFGLWRARRWLQARRRRGRGRLLPAAVRAPAQTSAHVPVTFAHAPHSENVPAAVQASVRNQRGALATPRFWAARRSRRSSPRSSSAGVEPVVLRSASALRSRDRRSRLHLDRSGDVLGPELGERLAQPALGLEDAGAHRAGFHRISAASALLRSSTSHKMKAARCASGSASRARVSRAASSRRSLSRRARRRSRPPAPLRLAPRSAADAGRRAGAGARSAP